VGSDFRRGSGKGPDLRMMLLNDLLEKRQLILASKDWPASFTAP
jgi:hypothetical protein